MAGLGRHRAKARSAQGEGVSDDHISTMGIETMLGNAVRALRGIEEKLDGIENAIRELKKKDPPLTRPGEFSGFDDD